MRLFDDVLIPAAMYTVVPFVLIGAGTVLALAGLPLVGALAIGLGSYQYFKRLTAKL